MIKAALKIVVIAVIFIYIHLLVFSTKFQEYIDENWRELRCKPYLIPVAGISSKAEGTNFFSKTINNFNNCTNTQVNSNINVFSKPLMELINGIVGGLSSIRNIINNFRNMAKVIRELFASLVQSTFERISNSFGTMYYFQEKLRNIIKRQSAVFEILSQFLTTMPFLFYSFSHGPIPRFAYWLKNYVGFLISMIVICILCAFGGPFVALFACPVCALCFHKDTIVKTQRGNIKISELKIGDIVGSGSNQTKVTGLMNVKQDIYELYNVDNVLLSGSHLVYNENKWTRVENLPGVSSNKYNTEIVCLTTENHTIEINGRLFSDYRETDDESTNTLIHQIMKDHINREPYNVNASKSTPHTKTEQDLPTYYWGFHKDTPVMIDDKLIKISEIVDNKLFTKNVQGGVKMELPDVIWYNYKGIIVSGNTLVKEDDTWVRVYESMHACKIDEKYQLYNIITSDNLVIVNTNGEKLLFRDMVESFDGNVNSFINKCLETTLNNNHNS
jgi:hypothetical protein